MTAAATPLVAPTTTSRRRGKAPRASASPRAAVAVRLTATSAKLIAEYTEVGSGQKVQRPELARALVECRAVGAAPVIAKLDRLAHNVAFLSALMDAHVEFLGSTCRARPAFICSNG